MILKKYLKFVIIAVLALFAYKAFAFFASSPRFH
jgi:hypothetical protein